MKHQIAKLNTTLLVSLAALRAKVQATLRDTKGTGAFDIVIVVLVSVVLGALLLTALYSLFNSSVLPGLTDKITDIFNFEG